MIPNHDGKHKQVWVKVNATVDEGAADLVGLLNQVEGLVTLDSCQGHEGWGWIYFRYGDWHNLGCFLFETLAPNLKGIEEISYMLESIDGDDPMAKLGFRTETIPQIVSALNGLFSVYRKSECSHDRECKEPRN